jgi:hypothetical protein
MLIFIVMLARHLGSSYRTVTFGKRSYVILPQDYTVVNLTNPKGFHYRVYATWAM